MVNPWGSPGTGAAGEYSDMARAIGLTPRERRWLAIMGWLVGVALFIRFTQILPCCRPPPLELALRGGQACDSTIVACPRYDDCAPR